MTNFIFSFTAGFDAVRVLLDGRVDFWSPHRTGYFAEVSE